jgi:hypothetical protein
MISVKTVHTIVLPELFYQIARAVVHPKSTAAGLLQRLISNKREEKQSTSQETTISVKGGTPAKHPAPQDQESGITLIILSYQRMRGVATWLERKAMEHVPRFIDRLTRKDKGSRELLSYGLHVWAHKQ